jgi:threonine aldolase
MGNLVCQLTLCGRGDEIILGDEAHILTSEQCGGATLGGINLRTVPNQPDGTLRLEDIEAAMRPDDVHCPRTRLIALENTHNRCSGAVLEIDYMNAVANLAKRHGLKLHVDGARIFNAAASLNVPAKELVKEADSVTFCLSKGLAAPAGSLVCGSPEFISEARRMRKILGGGMRQVGILAAAGIVAMTEMMDRLTEDHVTAKKLAEGLAELDGIAVDPSKIKTNIVFFRIDRSDLTPAELSERLKVRGVRIGPKPPDMIRAVTNYHVTLEDIDYVLGVLREILK